MDSRLYTYKRIGYLKSNIVKMVGIDFTGIIYASPGVLKHIDKRHGKQFNTRSKDSIIEWMKEILEEPDYIGLYHNMKGMIAINLIKEMHINLLLGIEIDFDNKYLYVSTMYPISERKINNKINSGKLLDIRGYTKENIESCIV